MGRWSQRRRTGGGPPTGTALIEMTSAVIGPADEVVVTYSANVTAGDFPGGEFASAPSGEFELSIAQESPSSLRLSMSGTVAGDVDLTYSGAVPGILTPQTINY